MKGSAIFVIQKRTRLKRGELCGSIALSDNMN